jgi:hypothetical protein
MSSPILPVAIDQVEVSCGTACMLCILLDKVLYPILRVAVPGMWQGNGKYFLISPMLK